MNADIKSPTKEEVDSSSQEANIQKARAEAALARLEQSCIRSSRWAQDRQQSLAQMDASVIAAAGSGEQVKVSRAGSSPGVVRPATTLTSVQPPAALSPSVVRR